MFKFQKSSPPPPLSQVSAEGLDRSGRRRPLYSSKTFRP